GLFDNRITLVETSLLLQSTGGIIFIYGLEKEFVVRSKDDDALEAARVVEAINDFATRFAVGIRGRGNRLMLGFVELVSRARAVAIDCDRNANGVISRLCLDRQHRRESD